LKPHYRLYAGRFRFELTNECGIISGAGSFRKTEEKDASHSPNPKRISKSVSRMKKKIISHHGSPCRNDSIGVDLPVVNFFGGRAVLDAC
jgi:hypothetical protein